jgi:hypothetical protein
MYTASEIEGDLPVELRIRGEGSTGSQHPWVCLRFLGEEEMVDLLQDRLGKSETEVRQVLESYHRTAPQT